MRTSRVCPCGFQVAENAPSTYPELVEQIEMRRRIVVYSGGAENTIFADRDVNYCFRAWHDWCHWRGRHDFTLQAVTAVWEMQSDHLVTIYGDSAMVRRWRKIL